MQILRRTILANMEKILRKSSLSNKNKIVFSSMAIKILIPISINLNLDNNNLHPKIKIFILRKSNKSKPDLIREIYNVKYLIILNS